MAPKTTDAAWDGSAARWDTAEAYCSACLINENEGDAAEWTKGACKLPYKEPTGEVNTNAVHAAAAALAGGRGGVSASPEALAQAKKKLANVYEAIGETPPESLTGKPAAKSHAVKAASDGAWGHMEGMAIPFGGPVNGKDLDGEYFTPQTDFAEEWFTERPLLYHHGLDGAVKTTAVGRQTSATKQTDGMWVQAQLDRSNAYADSIWELVQAGKLYFSSGAISHLVQKAPDGRITRWPWVEQSLTPTPANPFAYLTPATSAKSSFKAVDMEVPMAVKMAVLEEELAGMKTSMDALKVGRTISMTNMEKLTAAHDSMQTAVGHVKDLMGMGEAGAMTPKGQDAGAGSGDGAGAKGASRKDTRRANAQAVKADGQDGSTLSMDDVEDQIEALLNAQYAASHPSADGGTGMGMGMGGKECNVYDTEASYPDAHYLIVEQGKDDTYWRVDYQINAVTNTVLIGTPIPVHIEYVTDTSGMKATDTPTASTPTDTTDDTPDDATRENALRSAEITLAGLDLAMIA